MWVLPKPHIPATIDSHLLQGSPPVALELLFYSTLKNRDFWSGQRPEEF